MTESEKMEFRAHMHIASNSFKDGLTSYNNHCTHDAKYKFENALQHFIKAREISIGKNDQALEMANQGIEKCNKYLNLIKDSSKTK